MWKLGVLPRSECKILLPQQPVRVLVANFPRFALNAIERVNNLGTVIVSHNLVVTIEIRLLKIINAQQILRPIGVKCTGEIIGNIERLNLPSEHNIAEVLIGNDVVAFLR